jgi:hypothetical protein
MKIAMKTVFLAAVVAIAISGSAFALLSANGTSLNGTSLNLAGVNGSRLNSPTAVDLNSLRLLHASVRH